MQAHVSFLGSSRVIFSIHVTTRDSSRAVRGSFCLTILSSVIMADRKAELDKKRKKLEELKRARELNKLQAKDREVFKL